MSISEAVRAWFLAPVLEELSLVSIQLLNQQKEILKIMVTQADLDAALTQLGTVVTSLQALITSEDTSITAAIADIQALLQQIANNPGGDFTSEVTALQSMAASLTTNSTDIQNQTAALVAAVAPPAAAQVKK